jgi:uncharacterized protein
MTQTHPRDALENSCYGRFQDGTLLVGDRPAGSLTSEIHSAFRAFLHDPAFPCLGARSLVNQHSYRFGLYRRLREPACTAGLAVDLRRFVEEMPSIEGDFSSFIACFLEPKVQSLKQFEAALWQQLAALHDIDVEEFAWNEDVSSDPDDSTFSFSFGGNAFFVVGLAPSASRWARRFPWPTLVFNNHEQFERLRRDQQFEGLRDAIRERDTKLHGTVNPMLSDYGAHSEARQYAGRQVGPDWKCPVHFGADEGGEGD